MRSLQWYKRGAAYGIYNPYSIINAMDDKRLDKGFLTFFR